jgi:protein-tyrosine-phosphatase
MPFENEYASYEPLRRILENPKVKALQSRLKVRLISESQDEIKQRLTELSKIKPSDFQPDLIIAIDGSHHEVKIENGFPGAEIGYITVASVLLFLNKVHEHSKEEFIDPKKFRETEKAETIDTVFPGCNIIIDDETSAKSSMRKTLFEEFKNTSVFNDSESLLDTYEHLLKIKIEKGTSDKPPECPHEDCGHPFTYNYGQYKCPHCKGSLYSTDAMRLHELMNSVGSNGELFGQIMSTIERLWLIHILRSFENQNWIHTLRRVAFFLDGPLAVFSTSSWLTKPIIQELRRLNNIANQKYGQDLIILGIEKSGTFFNHFEELDTSKEGAKDIIPVQSAFLLFDQYIKKNIIFSTSAKNYGVDTYFGRKFFYKTLNGYRIVPNLAFYSDEQGNIKTALPNQFPRLADVLSLLDKLVSSRYPHSVTPLISAHAEAAIPLNLGKKIFEEIAQEIRTKS